MDLRLQHPSNTLVVGASGAGKSYLVKRIVENRKALFNVDFDEVFWYFAEWQSIYEELKRQHNVIFVEGPPSLEHFPPNQGPKLVIVDDFMDQIKNPEFLKIAIKGSHHRSLSFWFLTQSLFPPNFRQISLQAHYVFMLKATRDLAQIRTFCLQIDPTNWRALMEAYSDATKDGHSYMLFDFHVRQLDHLRLRTHIFPSENTIIYVPKNKYKSSMIADSSSVVHDGSSRTGPHE
jgi:hypothetical protein